MKEIPFGRPLLGPEEKKVALEVLEGSHLVHGPRMKSFEDAFAAHTGTKHAVSLSNATVGLNLAYSDLGIGPGDEVIIPAQTHVATAQAAEYTGASCVFVDAELRTGNIDIDQIEAAITPKTRAIAVVHFLGMPVDMPRLMKLAKKHNLRVVEDCALALE
jgi:perosamine synthetase